MPQFTGHRSRLEWGAGLMLGLGLVTPSGCRSNAGAPVVRPSQPGEVGTSEEGPVPPPSEASPTAAGRLEIGPDWWKTRLSPPDGGRWARTRSDASVSIPTLGPVGVPSRRVTVLEATEDSAAVAVRVAPVVFAATVPMAHLERGLITEPVRLRADDGRSWITLEPGASVTPVTAHAFEGDSAPVIVEQSLACVSYTWRGTVPTSSIGRIVDASLARSETAGLAGTLRVPTTLADETGHPRLEFGPRMAVLEGLRAVAVEPDGDRIKVAVPFAHVTLEGWVDTAKFDPGPEGAPTLNPDCFEATAVEQPPTATPRDETLLLPDQTCLYAEDGRVVGVVRPPTMLTLGPEGTQEHPPEPIAVAAERLDDHRWRVWIPTELGELPFVTSDAPYARCPADG